MVSYTFGSNAISFQGVPLVITSLADGNILGYQASTGTWINRVTLPATAGVDSVNALTGAVTCTTPSSTLTIGTSGQDVTFDINFAQANTWAGPQTFNALTKTSGITGNAVSKTSAYTVLSTDEIVLGNATSAAFTITLPASSGSGRKLILMKSDSSTNAVTVAAAGTDTIEGSATKSLAAQYDKIGLIDAESGLWIDLGTGGGI